MCEEQKEQYRIMIDNDKEFVIDSIIGKNNKLTRQDVKIEELEEEIERLTAESTKWESKFYDEAKKVDKAISYIKSHSYNKSNRWGLCMNEINEVLEILDKVENK